MTAGKETCVSGCEKPAWVDNPQKVADKKNMAIVGVASNFDLEDVAREQAEIDAGKRTARSMGSVVENAANEGRKITGALGERTEVLLQEQINQFKTKGVSLGEYKEYHVQKVEKALADGSVKYMYSVWVLCMVPEDAMSEYLKRQIQQMKASEAEAKVQQELDELEKNIVSQLREKELENR
jgi:DNA-binding transcriptional MerR regulator